MLMKEIILLEMNIDMDNSTLISSSINQIIADAIIAESLQEKVVIDVLVSLLKDFWDLNQQLNIVEVTTASYSNAC